jgi:Ca2+/H+ antiporter, TMEM165/GDT1 family
MQRYNRSFKIRKVAGILVMVIAGVLVMGSIVMLLWNALMPVLFHLPVVTFWQALGLLLLTKILFSGFRGGGPRARWKEKLNDRWTNMTPEDREKFKQEWGRRCGGRFRGPGAFGGEKPFATEETGAAEEKNKPS